MVGWTHNRKRNEALVKQVWKENPDGKRSPKEEVERSSSHRLEEDATDGKSGGIWLLRPNTTLCIKGHASTSKYSTYNYKVQFIGFVKFVASLEHTFLKGRL